MSDYPKTIIDRIRAMPRRAPQIRWITVCSVLAVIIGPALAARAATGARLSVTPCPGTSTAMLPLETLPITPAVYIASIRTFDHTASYRGMKMIRGVQMRSPGAGNDQANGGFAVTGRYQRLEGVIYEDDSNRAAGNVYMVNQNQTTIFHYAFSGPHDKVGFNIALYNISHIAVSTEGNNAQTLDIVANLVR